MWPWVHKGWNRFFCPLLLSWSRAPPLQSMMSIIRGAAQCYQSISELTFMFSGTPLRFYISFKGWLNNKEVSIGLFNLSNIIRTGLVIRYSSGVSFLTGIQGISDDIKTGCQNHLKGNLNNCSFTAEKNRSWSLFVLDFCMWVFIFEHSLWRMRRPPGRAADRRLLAPDTSVNFRPWTANSLPRWQCCRLVW